MKDALFGWAPPRLMVDQGEDVSAPAVSCCSREMVADLVAGIVGGQDSLDFPPEMKEVARTGGAVDLIDTTRFGIVIDGRTARSAPMIGGGPRRSGQELRHGDEGVGCTMPSPFVIMYCSSNKGKKKLILISVRIC